MVGMLRLYREETYWLLEDAKLEDIINSEMALRTLWVMGSMASTLDRTSSCH
jgi:hypothetical protein